MRKNPTPSQKEVLGACQGLLNPATHVAMGSWKHRAGFRAEKNNSQGRTGFVLPTLCGGLE